MQWSNLRLLPEFLLQAISKQGEGILLIVTMEFTPESHGKVGLENLTLAPMQPGRRELGWL
jgi:hypothetical protein